MLMLHSALQCCAPFLERIQHSVHSKSLALKCTRHSVHSTQWTLSTQCHSPYRHSVLSASIVWSHVPVSPDDLWPLSLSAPHPGLPRLRVDLSRNFELEVPPRALSAGAARRVRGQKLWFKKKL